MFRHILCPINFTTFSHHALERAAIVARAHGAALTGLCVVGATRARATVANWPQREWTGDDLERMQAEVVNTLQEVNAPSPTGVAVLGDPAAEIVKLANASRPDLIVMPVHGWTGLKAHACGSVTQQVLCHAPVPVLLVPDSTGARASNNAKAFDRIVCGINFSPASLKALRYAADLAAYTRAHLVVTHAVRDGNDLPAAAVGEPSHGGEAPASTWQRRLHAAADGDIPPGLTVDERLMTGNPAAAILEVADHERCDLIVIGGHRGNPPGCVMNAVVTQSRIPVLVVRATR